MKVYVLVGETHGLEPEQDTHGVCGVFSSRTAAELDIDRRVAATAAWNAQARRLPSSEWPELKDEDYAYDSWEVLTFDVRDEKT